MYYFLIKSRYLNEILVRDKEGVCKIVIIYYDYRREIVVKEYIRNFGRNGFESECKRRVES